MEEMEMAAWEREALEGLETVAWEREALEKVVAEWGVAAEGKVMP